MLNHILLNKMLIADGNERPGVKLEETTGEGILQHFMTVTGGGVGLPLQPYVLKGCRREQKWRSTSFVPYVTT